MESTPLPPRIKSLSPFLETVLEVAYRILGPSKVELLERQRAKLVVRIDRISGSSREGTIERQREFEATEPEAIARIREMLEAKIDMAYARMGIIDRVRYWIERKLIPDPGDLARVPDSSSVNGSKVLS